MPQIAVIPLFCAILGFLSVVCDSIQTFQSDEVKALDTFKRSIYEDPLHVFLNWNVLESDPCDFSGVSCSLAKDHVIKINISGSSIRGFIAPELFQITFLEELILRDNNLIGTIPKEIGSLKHLKVLDLSSNRITGPIPVEIGDLTSIVKINLGSNGLTGQLPYEFGNLNYLEELRLDRNRLQGNVPGAHYSLFPPNMSGMYTSNVVSTGLCRSSQLKVVDFSFNFLVGTIPKCLDNLPRISFQGNCLQQNHSNVPKQRPAEKCGRTPPSKSHAEVTNFKHPHSNEEAGRHLLLSKPRWLLIMEIVTGVLVGSILIAALITTCKKYDSTPPLPKSWLKFYDNTDKNHLVSHFIDKGMLKDVTSFSRQELEVACEDFSNIIGSSSDSIVYKGIMKEGPEIAVISICAKEEQWTGFLELYFQKEVADLARLDHENTGKLMGYCIESLPFTRMLVFDYASNGTLYEHLHYGEGCQLSWTRRMNIIIGVAKGLKYLHTDIQPPFTISELNSKAVYLTEDFSPKVVDFESWKSIFSRSENDLGSISLEGSLCALPNTNESRDLDIQANIYAFGLLLLEVVTGRPTYCKNRECLADWAKQYLDVPEVISYMVDPELKHFRYDDLKAICEVVNHCIDLNCREATSMEKLCEILVSRIDTSVTSELKSSTLAWAELALSS